MLPTWPQPELRGAAAALAQALLTEGRSGEYVISGPSETGKTHAACHVLDTLLRRYPGSQAVLVRQVRDTIYSSCLPTYTRISDARGGVVAHGGNKPEWLDYANGSRLWIAGMDRPGKALSSERDFVYINQAEELAYDSYQTLTTRATGRAANAPLHAVFADCNPGGAHHWIKQRPFLQVLESRHEDNPTLYDADGTITARGVATMAVLDALEGVLKERLRYGRWVSQEGAVYAFDARVHVVTPYVIPQDWRRIRAIDYGFMHPFVCIWIAISPDGQLIVYRQLGKTQALVEDLTKEIIAATQGERIEATVADHDAEDRATMHRHGITTQAAYKPIARGIQALAAQLKVRGDGKPGFVVFRDCLIARDERLAAARQPVTIEQEFDAYVWPKDAGGRSIKETPVDQYNHFLDAARYACAYVQQLQRTAQGASRQQNYLLEGATDA